MSAKDDDRALENLVGYGDYIKLRYRADRYSRRKVAAAVRRCTVGRAAKIDQMFAVNSVFLVANIHCVNKYGQDLYNQRWEGADLRAEEERCYYRINNEENGGQDTTFRCEAAADRDDLPTLFPIF